MCVGVGGEPRKTAPTPQRGGELWSCCGSGRFGDTTQGGTRQVQRQFGFFRLVCFFITAFVGMVVVQTLEGRRHTSRT